MIPEEITYRYVEEEIIEAPSVCGGLKFSLIFHLHPDLVYMTDKTVHLSLLGKLNKVELLYIASK